MKLKAALIILVFCLCIVIVLKDGEAQSPQLAYQHYSYRGSTITVFTFPDGTRCAWIGAGVHCDWAKK